jgi:CheY-like chemotaxis protein
LTEPWPPRSRSEAAILRRLLAALTAVRDGDVSLRLPGSPDPLLNDISDAFNSLSARLDERAAARERFLPTLSHELRTPLNSMLVLARLLADNPDGNLTGEQVEYARVIFSAGSDLLRVISGLLDADGNTDDPESDHAAPEPGRRLLVVEATRGGLLTLLARGAVSDSPSLSGPVLGGPVEVLTAATADQVADALADGLPHCVLLDLGADAELVTATLSLLRSRPGSRWMPLLAHARDEAAAARLATLGVQQAELVRSPAQLRERVAWHLSAAARPAAVHPDSGGGAGDGAVNGGAGDGGAGPAALHGKAALRGKKVLVVDDDPRNVFAITSTLELHGMTVLRSADGRAGIDQLRSEPDTDLVLMDLMMPGMDGYAAISAIRDMPEFSELPIIAVTAHTMTGELAGGVPGADACLAKPLDTDELLGRMATCLVS